MPPTAERQHLCHSAAAPVKGEASYLLRGQPRADRGDAAGGPSDRIKVMPWGLTEFRYGKLLVNDAAVSSIKQRMLSARRDRVRIDREHATAFKPSLDRDPEDILGYGDIEAVPGDGVYLCNIAWTATGLKQWSALPDPSPAFNARESDFQVTNLDSVGLCCDGELKLPTLCSADSPPTATTPPGTYLQSPSQAAMNELMIAMLKKAGVKVPDQGTQSDEEYGAALTAACTTYLEGGGEAGPGEAPKKDETQTAASADLAARLKKLEDSDAARAQAAERTGKEEIMRLCSAEGKVMPLSDEQIYGSDKTPATPLGVMRSIYTNLKPTVAVGTQQQRQGDKTEVKVALSAEDRQVAAMMGVKEEDMILAKAAA